MRKMFIKLALAAALAAPMASQAGPVILGGDDLNDHGSWSGTSGVLGWLYIQNALASLLSQTTLPGNDGTIVVLGAAPTTPASATSTSGDSCGAVYWPATALSRTVTCIEGAAAITAYMTGVGNGTNKPAVIVYPGDGASNGVDSAEEAAIAASASAISTFVGAGGGVLGHSGPYTWLTSLIPGITISSNCESSGAALTPLGQTTFPAVTNTDIAAGPCHQSFGGNLGSLQALALDGNNAQFIIGGGGGTIITAALPEKPVPTLGFNALAALMALVVAAAFVVRGRMASLRGQ